MNSKNTTQDPNQENHQTEKRILTLEDIFKNGDYVICDTGVFKPGGDWFRDTFFGLRQKSELLLGPIEREIESVKIFINSLGNSKVFVTTGVSQEISGFASILKNVIGYILKIKRVKNKDWLKEGDFEKLKELYELCDTCYYKSRNFEFSPEQKTTYSFLERIVLSVTEFTGAKIDYGKIYHPDRRPKEREDFHTDEQLVATALYLSYVENKSGVILTKDSDLRRILFNTLSYLTYPYISDYREILNSAKRNSIKIYYRSQTGEFQQRYNSSEFISDSCQGISKEKLAAIRFRINSPSEIH